MTMELLPPMPAPGGTTPGGRHRSAPGDDRLDRELRRMELMYRRSVTARVRAMRRRVPRRTAQPDL